jgi:uncharacterized protein YndB with AHSA1/START domain
MTLNAAFPGPSIPLIVLGLLLVALAAAGAVVLGGRLRLQRSVVIDAPPETVWVAIRHLPSLLARHGRSASAAIPGAWSLLRGDGAGTGSVWRLSAARDDGRAPACFDFEVLHADPGRLLTYRIVRTEGGRPRRRPLQWSLLSFEAVDAGTTKLTYRLEARGRAIGLRHRIDPDRVRADLFDLRLRSLRADVGQVASEEPARSVGPPAETRREASGGDLDAPTPAPAPRAAPRSPDFTL